MDEVTYESNDDIEIPESKVNDSSSFTDFHEMICEPFDIYDKEENECLPPEHCQTVDECALLGDELAYQIMDRFEDGIGDYEFDEEGQSFDEQELIRYTLDGEYLLEGEFTEVDDQFTELRDDFETHEYIWDMFRYLIPAEVRKMVSGFIIFTDGYDETLAQVEPDDNDIHKWLLGVDSMDTQNSSALRNTLLHEFAHLLTLGQHQMDMDEDVLYADENDEIHQISKNACDNYFVDGMGCTKEDSYLNHFYHAFWADIIDDWQVRGVLDDEDEASLFYDDYEDHFVTDYAVTNPDEDIAETWMYFILSPRPEGEEIWEEKILFFHQYPEQVKLRAEILSRLLSYMSLHDDD